MMEDRILLSETPRLWVIPSSSKPLRYKLAVLDHIEDDSGQVIEKLPQSITSDANQTQSSGLRTVFSKKKDSITAFRRYLGGRIHFYGVVNQDNRVVCAFIDFEFRGGDVFLFYDSIRQLRVLNTLVSYDGDILLETDGGKLVCSNSGYHLFLERKENNETRWKIFTPDLSLIDVEVPYSEQWVNRGFDHGIMLLGSTLINRDGKVILKDVHDYRFHEDLSVFIVEDEETYNYNNSYYHDSRNYYRIVLNKEGTVLYGVYGGDWDSYKLIDNYLLEKDLRVWRTGIASPDFSILLPMCFEYISSCDLKNPSWWIVKIDGRYGILSKDCKSWIIKPLYDVIKYDKIGVFKFSDSLGSGLMSLHGEVFFRTQDKFDESTIENKFYLRASEEYPESIVVTIIGKDWDVKSGVVSQDKGEIIPIRHGWIIMQSSPLRSNRFLIREGGTISDSSEYGRFSSDARVIRYNGGLLGLLGETGNVVLPSIYSSIEECSLNGYLPCYLAQHDHEWILYDFNGQPLLEDSCTYISWYESGYARFIVGGSIYSENVHKGGDVYQQTSVLKGKFGLFSLVTRHSTGPVYDYIGDVEFTEGKFSAEACLNGRWGTINGRLEFIPSGYQEKEIPVKVFVSEQWIGEEDNPSGYTSADFEDMYRAAYEGDPEAQWNTD